MTELFLLIVKDRHTDVDVQAYSTLEKANAGLDKWVRYSARCLEDIEEDDLDEAVDGAVRSVTYSSEGDYATIVRRVVDAD